MELVGVEEAVGPSRQRVRPLLPAPQLPRWHRWRGPRAPEACAR